MPYISPDTSQPFGITWNNTYSIKNTIHHNNPVAIHFAGYIPTIRYNGEPYTSHKNTIHSNNTDAIHSNCAYAIKTQFIPITPMPYISPVETQCFASPFTQRRTLPLYNIARRHYAPLCIFIMQCCMLPL